MKLFFIDRFTNADFEKLKIMIWRKSDLTKHVQGLNFHLHTVV